MNFFPQPCLALPESPKLRAKQGHATSATQNSKPHSNPAPTRSGFRTFKPSHIWIPFRPASAPRTLVGALRPWREQSVLQSPTTNLPFRPASAPRTRVGALRPWREQSAFSLTEVVIAMGVAAVAFTSIIALFPLGLNMSKDSYDETQAALIAQTILSDLKDQQTGNRNKRYTVAAGSPYSYKLIQIAGNVDPQIVTTNYLGIDLRLLTQQNVYLAYDAQSRKDTDTTSQPIMLRPSAGLLNTIPPWYSGTTISNGLAAVVKVTFVPTFSITTLNATTGVLRVDISIETPGSAKPENRTVRLYTGAVVP